jgi:hypothetical protein
MADTSGKAARRPVSTVAAGVALILIALVLDFVLQRHGFLSLDDSKGRQTAILLIFPLSLFFVFSTGVIVAVFAGNRSFRWILIVGIGCSIPLTVLYAFFVFGEQALDSGADHFGDCGGLEQTAISSNVIPDPRPHFPPNVGCGTQKRGMFLTPYNELTLWGVKDRAAQQRVLDRLDEYRRRAHTHRVQVVFIEERNMLVQPRGNGVTSITRQPEKVIRIVNIG